MRDKNGLLLFLMTTETRITECIVGGQLWLRQLKTVSSRFLSQNILSSKSSEHTMLNRTNVSAFQSTFFIQTKLVLFTKFSELFQENGKPVPETAKWVELSRFECFVLKYSFHKWQKFVWIKIVIFCFSEKHV